ncbi:nucleotide exchange factor GrpE [Sporosarcina oncorhynchi]|uniref:Protein GrpE n=2 Tax=Sporosarcina oncorhynchi TaxID=3056444 RepID=A0ABZ0L9K8_9BACL|nr:nucleotide exchange factor GrpE [Sporosarcina sp. T2O-4]WOV89175.1 nucleotide exchange factor GrpE [Sporosarcina sp. T2O-4]
MENDTVDTEKDVVEMNDEGLAEQAESDELANDSMNQEMSKEPSEETDPKDQKIAELESALEEEENKMLRILADFENSKRRATLDKEAMNKYKAQSILTGLLPVLDNFERALAVEAKADEAKSLMTGMDMIYRNLLESLKAEGLVEIDCVDKEFDPNFHQAVMTEKDPDKESNIVLQELQKGYMLKDRVLRPSMVKVNE